MWLFFLFLTPKMFLNRFLFMVIRFKSVIARAVLILFTRKIWIAVMWEARTLKLTFLFFFSITNQQSIFTSILFYKVNFYLQSIIVLFWPRFCNTCSNTCILNNNVTLNQARPTAHFCLFLYFVYFVSFVICIFL